MTSAQSLLALLAAITLVATWRAWRRGQVEAWSRARRIAVLVLQPLLAALLALALLPPQVPGVRATLIVLTAGATAPDAPAPGEIVIALPEAGPVANALVAPDLATALRRTPAASLRVVGEGLVARDREAARGLPLAFAPGAAPHGLVALRWPGDGLAGATLSFEGEIAGLDGARAELLDPAGRRIALASPDDQGRFFLSAVAGVPGDVDYVLRVIDGDGRTVERQSLPVQVRAGDAHRILLLSGAPNPETKYLRRWALDAGLALTTRQALGGGAAIGDAPARLDADTLAGTDLLVLDERSWRSLGSRGRDEVLAAVEGGLGLLLRITGPVSADERAGLARRGLVLSPDEGPRAISLPPGRQPAADEGESAPALSRAGYTLRAAGGDTVLADTRGAPLLAWQAHGQGRIGAWLVTDSFRWVLAGHSGAHGRLWADAVSALARPRAPASSLRLPAWSRVGERVSLCGLGEAARLTDPEGDVMPLVPDPATGADACAAAWPRKPGRFGVDDGTQQGRWTVFAAEALPGLAARERRDATVALAALSPEAANVSPTPPVPGPRWPWWAAWLAAAALAWWLERPRRD